MDGSCWLWFMDYPKTFPLLATFAILRTFFSKLSNSTLSTFFANEDSWNKEIIFFLYWAPKDWTFVSKCRGMNKRLVTGEKRETTNWITASVNWTIPGQNVLLTLLKTRSSTKRCSQVLSYPSLSPLLRDGYRGEPWDRGWVPLLKWRSVTPGYCARYFVSYETFEWVELYADEGNCGGKRESRRVGQESQEYLSQS